MPAYSNPTGIQSARKQYSTNNAKVRLMRSSHSNRMSSALLPLCSATHLKCGGVRLFILFMGTIGRCSTRFLQGVGRDRWQHLEGGLLQTSRSRLDPASIRNNELACSSRGGHPPHLFSSGAVIGSSVHNQSTVHDVQGISTPVLHSNIAAHWESELGSLVIAVSLV